MLPRDPWEHCDRLLANAGRANEKEEMCTAASLVLQPSRALSTGLGDEVDIDLLCGGLRVGEVLEIYGPAAVGKTQLGLSICAHIIGVGGSVLYVTSKDRPLDLASRLCGIIQARIGTPEVPDALRQARVVSALDFSAFAKVITAFEMADRADLVDQVLIIDSLSGLLAPFASASGWGHRWRLAWSFRSLQRLSTDLGVRVVLLSHTVGAARCRTSSPLEGKAQLALGQLWTSCAATRLELMQDAGERHLVLAVRKSPRGRAGAACHLVLDDAGVHV